MTLNQLEYALYLQKYGNFKKAAERLGISQPALSIQIQKLEEEIQIALFNRTTSPITATKDGVAFLSKSQEIISGVKQLRSFSQELKGDFNGRLVIGIIPTLAPFLVPLFIDALQKDYPGIQLVIKEQITERILENIRHGELDVGLISTPVRVHGIEAIPLFYERFYVYASGNEVSKNELRIDEIDQEKLWLLDEGNCFRDQVSDFCNLSRIREGKDFVYQSNSIDALIRIVDTKGGMTILPELTSLSLNENQEENLKVISGKPRAREIGMVVTPKHDKDRYIRVLGDYIRQNIPHHMLEKNNYIVVDPHIQVK
ncbi:MAG: LysR substrate-binding domain-containing protein [Cyclobacteriaceae bacterium]